MPTTGQDQKDSFTLEVCNRVTQLLRCPLLLLSEDVLLGTKKTCPVSWAGHGCMRQWINLARDSSDGKNPWLICQENWKCASAEICQHERSRGLPSQPEDEFVLVLSTAGDWNVNMEPNKLLVSKALAALRSCLITIWFSWGHAAVCSVVSRLVALRILWLIRSA